MDNRVRLILKSEDHGYSTPCLIIQEGMYSSQLKLYGTIVLIDGISTCQVGGCVSPLHVQYNETTMRAKMWAVIVSNRKNYSEAVPTVTRLVSGQRSGIIRAHIDERY